MDIGFNARKRETLAPRAAVQTEALDLEIFALKWSRAWRSVGAGIVASEKRAKQRRMNLFLAQESRSRKDALRDAALLSAWWQGIRVSKLGLEPMR